MATWGPKESLDPLGHGPRAGPGPGSCWGRGGWGVGGGELPGPGPGPGPWAHVPRDPRTP